jgi:glycosyltransferase involved in cell wall biosynthesis
MPIDRSRTVLIVAAEFPPLKTIGRIRTVKFVEHLRQHGWQSIVVTLEPSGREPIYDPKLMAEILPDTEVIRLPLVTFDERITNFAKRLLGRGRPDLSSPHRRGPSQGQLDGRFARNSPQGAACAGSFSHLRRNDKSQPIAARPDSGSPATPGSASATGKTTVPGLGERLQLAVKRWIRLGLDIPDNYLPWAFATVPRLRQLCQERKIDVIFTTLPPFSAAYVGYRLTHETDIPWIADYRDLWYGDVLREWLPRWRQRLELMIEKRLLRRAAAVVTVSEQKTDYMRRLHPNIKARWETLTNGFDNEIYADRGRTRAFDTGTIEFVYTGRLFKNRRGYAFAEALGRLKRTHPNLVAPVRVRILGGVAPEITARYETILSEYGLHEHFNFPGDVAYAEAMDAQVNCDYLLLIVDTGETSDGVIPGKLFEYVAARRPIFALCDPGATQQIIERAGLGTVVNAEDVAACEARLKAVLSQPVPQELVPDEAYLARFDRWEITARLARLLDQVSSAHG